MYSINNHIQHITIYLQSDSTTREHHRQLYVTTTDEFISKIKDMNLEDDEYIAVLDIKDLFTNVPITQAVNIILNRVGKSEAFRECILTKLGLKELLVTCLQNSYFTFNSKYFRQNNGLPMGILLSPLLADLYMDKFVTSKLDKINNKLCRYVDDLIIIIKITEDEIKSCIEQLYSSKGTIKFTY